MLILQRREQKRLQRQQERRRLQRQQERLQQQGRRFQQQSERRLEFQRVCHKRSKQEPTGQQQEQRVSFWYPSVFVNEK